MKKLFLFSITCFFNQLTFGQDISQKPVNKPTDDPKYIEFKKRHDDVTAKRNQDAHASSYFGYDETLKSIFIGNSIPSETPRSNGYALKSDYIKVLNEWMSKNKKLLKPENQNSLITE